MDNRIIISTTINSDLENVWVKYTDPAHITKWNFADLSWHCPNAENDLKIGGIYKARMEAKDGSFGFDFEARYTELKELNEFTYKFGERFANVKFSKQGYKTQITIAFDPENENPIDMQRAGWKSILENFKNYVESNN